jgi:hypothetical protein
VLVRFCLVLVFIAIVVPLRAQDEPIHMRPEFPLIFPLEQNGKDVTVKYPVLINPTTVIKPGMVLRVLYVLSIDAQPGGSDLVLAHHGDASEAYARDPSSSLGDKPRMSPEMAHEIEGYRRTVWEVANNFVLAMAQYPTNAMHLIYSPTGKNGDLHDERFTFFDGLFLGAPNAKVSVIAVEKESYADQAGIRAGDEIVSVGGNPTQDSLTIFPSAYYAAKKVAKDNDADAYTMTIRRAGGGEAQVKISLPPKIKTGLMDGFK